MAPVPIDLFTDTVWQMAWGERAAVAGLLGRLAPALAIEIGSMEGACLREIAAHSTEVHSFDLSPPSLPQPANVTLHTGDSHQLLPEVLAGFAARGANVDFVLVDGDHSPEGVRRDLEDLLDSPAVAASVILIHDTANERVRAGVDAVRFSAWPKVTYVDLDWVPGRMFAEPALRDELWFGLGLVLIDAGADALARPEVFEGRYRPAAPLLGLAKTLWLAREAARLADPDGDPVGVLAAELEAARAEAAALRLRALSLQDELVHLRQLREHLDACTAQLQEARAGHAQERERREELDRILADVLASPSWKLTGPLRAAKGTLTGRRG
jgi:hypothetical protein